MHGQVGRRRDSRAEILKLLLAREPAASNVEVLRHWRSCAEWRQSGQSFQVDQLITLKHLLQQRRPCHRPRDRLRYAQLMRRLERLRWLN